MRTEEVDPFDLIELLMNVEDAFEMKLTEEECGRAGTVGELHSIIVDKLGTSADKDVCLTSHTFYRLRRTIKTLFVNDDRRISPAMRMEILVPLANRRKAWSLLGHTLTCRIPRLSRPGWILPILFVVSGVLLLDAVVSGDWEIGFASLGFLLLGYGMTIPLATQIPSCCGTMGKLARTILKLNFGKILRDRNAFSERDVWETLRAIVAEKLGVEIEEVTRNALFVDLAAS